MYCKIVGNGKITEEYTRKVSTTKNTTTETIVRKTVKTIVLECGHQRKLTEWSRAKDIPKIRIYCRSCS